MRPRIGTIGERHVLLVADDDGLAATLQDVLVAAGFRVTLARDGYRALIAVAQRRPDVILTDARMSPPGGLRLLEMLRSEHVVIPSILIAARPLAGDHGADAVLMTPLDLDQLLTTIRRLSRPRAEPSLPEQEPQAGRSIVRHRAGCAGPHDS